MEQIDIETEDLNIVRSLLRQFVPQYEVWAFGSRVKKTARKFSDLDLVVITDKRLDFDCYAALKNAFSESNLPFKVDVVDWSSIDDNFKTIIKEKHVVLQEMK